MMMRSQHRITTKSQWLIYLLYGISSIAMQINKWFYHWCSVLWQLMEIGSLRLASLVTTNWMKSRTKYNGWMFSWTCHHNWCWLDRNISDGNGKTWFPTNSNQYTILMAGGACDHIRLKVWCNRIEVWLWNALMDSLMQSSCMDNLNLYMPWPIGIR